MVKMIGSSSTSSNLISAFEVFGNDIGKVLNIGVIYRG
jgi:hypothetical protein